MTALHKPSLSNQKVTLVDRRKQHRFEVYTPIPTWMRDEGYKCWSLHRVPIAGCVDCEQEAQLARKRGPTQMLWIAFGLATMALVLFGYLMWEMVR